MIPCRIETAAGIFLSAQFKWVGHEVSLVPAHYVKPYMKRAKNDAADAEAICEAVTRPTMRFVPPKSEEAQAIVLMHRLR